jgi:hypothetical protein
VADLKVLTFDKQKEEPREARLPNEEEFKHLIGEGKKIAAAIVILTNSDGQISHFIDLHTNFEAIATLESVKTYIMLNDVLRGE